MNRLIEVVCKALSQYSSLVFFLSYACLNRHYCLNENDILKHILPDTMRELILSYTQ